MVRPQRQTQREANERIRTIAFINRLINDEGESNDEGSDNEMMQQQSRRQRRRLERDAEHFVSTPSIPQVFAVMQAQPEIEIAANVSKDGNDANDVEKSTGGSLENVEAHKQK